MKLKSTLLVSKGLVLTLLFSLLAQAGISQNLWVVSNDPSYDADFDNVQTAVDSAASGDKIYVHGSPTPYPSFSVSKKLHLIGSGYWKSENMIPDLNLNSTIINPNVVFQSGSSGSIFEGFQINGELHIETDSIIVRYNRYGRTLFNNQPQTCLIYGNRLDLGFQAALVGSASNTLIYNNIISSAGGYIYFWENSTLNSGCFLDHNSIIDYPVISNCSVFNNIFHYGLPNSFNNVGVPQYNIFTNNTTGLDTTNLINADVNTIWDLADPSGDGRYQLIGDTLTNPAFNFANDGSDVGAFGGATPYRLSGIVRIPTIYSMIIPLAGDTTNMLNVRIRARSN